MIEQRILKLLKTPEDIQVEDLPILENEIGKYPFIQSIRALYLYGTHRYDQAEYKSLLTATAAYTTDKKILYQFINREENIQVKDDVKVEENVSETQPETSLQNGISLQSKFESSKSTFPKIKVEEEVIEQLSISNETNLEASNEYNITIQEIEETEFIVEEAIVDTTPEIVSDETSEVNHNDKVEAQEIEKPINEVIVVEEAESSTEIESVEEVEKSTDEDSFTDEVTITSENKDIETVLPYEISIADPVINKEDISIDVEIEQPKQDDSQLSFYERFDHLPKVQIHSVKEDHITEAPQQNPERHLSEMDRLIAEVEAKMKLKKAEAPKQEKEEVFDNFDISFAENYDTENDTQQEKEETSNLVVENTIEEKVMEETLENIIVQEQPAEVKSEWKPLIIESHKPDALISLDSSKVLPQESIQKETPKPAEKIVEMISNVDSVHQIEEKLEEQDERPVFNVSFFSDTVQPFTPSEVQKEETIIVEKENKEETEQSNIPHFINTWQNWLKIDKTNSVLVDQENSEEQLTESKIEIKEEIKAKAIDAFIENNPKISKLKDETDFVVKEKSENISHLMTETLAGLYVQQKLYTKAIGAYQILKEKHPEKEAYFEEKIQEVKEIRSGK